MRRPVAGGGRARIGTNSPFCVAPLLDLREHAIFALRNLLDRNLENQAVVDAVKPVGRWDENKVLQELRVAAGRSS